MSHLSSNYHKKAINYHLFKMKATNFSSSVPNQFKSKDKEAHNLEKKITKELLDKYKPKVLQKIETLNEKKDQRRVA